MQNAAGGGAEAQRRSAGKEKENGWTGRRGRRENGKRDFVPLSVESRESERCADLRKTGKMVFWFA